MKVFTFIAESAPEAVAQIRAQLGPEAVVLNVRKLEPDGLQKIWRKPRIEVVAHVPEPEPPAKADPLQAILIEYEACCENEPTPTEAEEAAASA